MKFKRIIPVLLVKDGLLVRSQIFKYHQAIGESIPTIKRLSDWNADEIIILNIGNSNQLDSRREDKYHNLGISTFSTLVKETTKFCHCPITIGGGLRTLQDIDKLFEAGADKVVLNTLLFSNPDVVRKASRKYGSQAITASIDIFTQNNNTEIITNCGKEKTGYSLRKGIELVKSYGVGEILISSINHDGSAHGYDKNIFSALDEKITLPIIINSGALHAKHFAEALENKFISGVAASNTFYFTELSYPNIKKEILGIGFENIRSPRIGSNILTREPNVDIDKRNQLLEKAKSEIFFDPHKYSGSHLKPIRFCRRCLYSSASASPMIFDDTGLCMGCRTYEVKKRISADDYVALGQKLETTVTSILKSSPSKDRKYDCIVSVSGGKDSYYQVHYVKNVLKLNPLLVTYNGNNYTDIGWQNLWQMRESFGCDHIVVSPSVQTIKKLNKLAFIVMGDMNWHAHVGIFTTAPRIAVQQNIPIIFWGEHGIADLCGQFAMEDFPEMNYRERTEHPARGFDWNFFVGIDGITEQDMESWKYPDDNDLFKVGLRQFFLGHYIPWESNDHLKMVIDKYNFKVSKEPFERTYRIGSNLDDMHENGIHDYLKYIKFGYGRCTDHASKDIRSGDLNRVEGIDRAMKMDPIKSKDLYRWLEYVDMTEDDFDRIADHFRDPRVWKWNEQSGWTKQNIS